MAVFARLVRAAARRPGRVLGAVAVLAAAGAALALTLLSPSAATGTLVSSSSPEYEATERYRQRFGDHSIVVLVRGSLPDIVLTENLGRLLALEGCLSGNKPADRPAPGGAGSPCDELATSKPVQVVYGPGTFVNSAVGEIQDQFAARSKAKAAEARRAADAARALARRQGRSPAEQDRVAKSAEQLVYAQFVRDLLQINLRYGLGARLPRLDDADFVSTLVFDPSRGYDQPKARFAYLFPNSRSAVIQVRLKPDLSDSERGRAIELVREAVAMDMWRPDRGVTMTVTGAPVVVDDLTRTLADSLLRLLAIALVVMALALALVFRSRLRLVPLAVAAAAVAITFGLMAVAGAPLTMASIAVLPVLLGLAVDYAIQYQARVEEAEQDADGAWAAMRAARVAVPTIAVAALATVVGFLVLLLSPVPMVRGFGVLLVVGIVLAFVLALSGGTAALVATARLRRAPDAGRLEPAVRSVRGAGEIVDGARLLLGRALRGPWAWAGTAARRVLRLSLARPAAVVAAGLALALGGWVLDSRAEVVSDVRELVPQDLRAVQDLETLQQTTDVAGEIDVVVQGRDLTDPSVVKWMRDYQQRVLARFGYSESRGCGEALLCPALSLPDLFRSEEAASSQAQIRGLLDAVPPYFSQAVITRDRTVANLAFGVKLVSLEEQQRVIDAMRAELRPPRGVSAELGGLVVLAAEANAALASPWRRLGTLAAGLLAVGLVLLAALRADRSGAFGGRRWARAWVPLVPIALATGWSALVLFALGVPLNPMSATLGALVLAISTEFSVLLCARYREERLAGHAVADALRRTYRSTGAAVLASGVTAIAGFAVLAFSDVTMLRDFGLVTVVDLSVSLLGVLAVLPAVLVLAERRRPRSAAAPPAEAPAVTVHA